MANHHSLLKPHLKHVFGKYTFLCTQRGVRSSMFRVYASLRPFFTWCDLVLKGRSPPPIRGGREWGRLTLFSNPEPHLGYSLSKYGLPVILRLMWSPLVCSFFVPPCLVTQFLSICIAPASRVYIINPCYPIHTFYRKKESRFPRPPPRPLS